MTRIAPIFLLLATTALAGAAQAEQIFVPGNLVVSVEGRGAPGDTNTYTDNQAAPLSLYQFSHVGTSNATLVSRTVLPQTTKGVNSAISGEYGSSSEGGLQLTADGKHLLIMGYGVNAATFNANPGAYSPSTGNKALGQSGSVVGAGYIPVPRVVAMISSDGIVDTSTAIYGVFNANNPRSVASVNGTSFYISGQGNSPDTTGGVFYALHGANTATPVTGLDTTGATLGQDTRIVSIHDGQLFVSVDSKEGSGSARSFIGTLGDSGALPTGLANGAGGVPDADSTNGPTMLPGFGNTGGTGKVTLTTLDDTNGINALGKTINLSPEGYFFANDDTLYVADSGDGKQTSGNSSLGDGGLQKWSYTDATGTWMWSLDYTLAAGLNLVANTSAHGATGLLGLTGVVVGGNVELFATNYTAGDTDPTFLYGITDILGQTASRPAGETFVQLAAAPADSNFKGVAFAPASVPEPGTYALLIGGFGVVGGAMRRRRRLAVA